MDGWMNGKLDQVDAWHQMAEFIGHRPIRTTSFISIYSSSSSYSYFVLFSFRDSKLQSNGNES